MKRIEKKVDNWFQAILGGILFFYGLIGLGLEFLGLFASLKKYSFITVFYGDNAIHYISSLSIILGVGVFLLNTSVVSYEVEE